MTAKAPKKKYRVRMKAFEKGVPRDLIENYKFNDLRLAVQYQTKINKRLSLVPKEKRDLLEYYVVALTPEEM